MPTTPCSFRPDEALHALIERRAALEGLSKARLLEAAVRHYLGAPPNLPFRRQFEVVLAEVLVCGVYGHSMALHTLGQKAVSKSLPDIGRRARRRAKAVLRKIEEKAG